LLFIEDEAAGFALFCPDFSMARLAGSRWMRTRSAAFMPGSASNRAPSGSPTPRRARRSAASLPKMYDDLTDFLVA
jgi:hypothetical protein